MIPLNDLTRGYEEQATELRQAAIEVLDSGWYVHGPRHAAFESDLAAFVGVPHAIGVASGTDALSIALRACTSDGHVLTAPNAGAYTSVAARSVGLTPVYADVDPTTHLLTADTISEALDDDPDIDVVVVTHLYGRLADMPAIMDQCRERDVLVLEDCAQAIGAATDAGTAGSFGDLAAFSFYPTKNLGALGDGGAIATGDETLADRVRSLRQYGWAAKYEVVHTDGRNSRLDELQAAVLSVRLPRVPTWNARRREIITAYADAAPSSIRVLPAADPSHAGHLAVVETDDRDRVRSVLEAAGVGTDIHYPIPDHRQPAWNAGSAALPVAERLANQVLSLPCFPQLTDDEVARVCDALASC